MGDEVGINDGGTELSENIGNGGFATANTAGDAQTEFATVHVSVEQSKILLGNLFSP